MAVVAINTLTTPIILNSGTLTASAPILNLSQTWNNAGVTFTGAKLNVTDTASASGSLLMDLQVGGVSQFSVSKLSGSIISNGSLILGSVNGVQVPATGNYFVQSRLALTSSADGILVLNNWAKTQSASLAVEAANTLALRNSTSAQAFRVYNTYTDASNYERGFIGFAGGSQFLVGTSQLGTGAARHLVFQTSGTDRWYINSASGYFLAATDNAYDIGASGANRPRDGFFGRNFTVGNALIMGAGGGSITWNGRNQLSSPADAVQRLSNNAGTITTDITLSGASAVGGSTAAFGGSIVSGGNVQVVSAGGFSWLGGKGGITQATDGVFTLNNNAGTNSVSLTVGASNLLTLNGGITAGGTIRAGASSRIGWAGVSQIYGGATNGNIVLSNAAATDFSLLQFGGTTSSFPAIKRNGVHVEIRLADDSARTGLLVGSVESAGTVTAGGAVVATTYSKTTAKTVATLDAAATAGAGARSFVTDATVSMAAGIGTIVVGGGANAVPVYSDGTNWLIG